MVSVFNSSFFKNKFFLLGLTSALVLAGSLAYLGLSKRLQPNANHITDEHISLNGTEKLRVLHAEKPEKGLLIYIADHRDAKKLNAYAKQFASLSYYVAVIDNDTLLKSPSNTNSQCLNLAQKLTDISKQIQTHYKLDDDELPILAATEHSSGTLYATLAQAKEHSFHAAVSINFTPQLNLQSALCEQHAFSSLENQQLKLVAVKRVPTSFYIFQDKNDSPEFAKFAENIGNVKLTVANDQKQNAQAEAIQILQWLDPRLADQISSDTSNSNIPLIEVPVEDAATASTTNSIAIILTGDGGWAEIDKNIAKILADKGIPTVALDSLSYFWKARTPEETASDIETVISQYLEKWNKKNVILIGYSFGADVLPFVANNLSAETQGKISLIALLGMGKTAAFEFRLSSWMNADTNQSRLPILPEITKMKWANSICIYGVEDDAANCLPTAELGVKTISMPGDHHFDERYDELVQHIIESEKPH